MNKEPQAISFMDCICLIFIFAFIGATITLILNFLEVI